MEGDGDRFIESVWLAAFDNSGLRLTTDVVHTLTTNPANSGQLYNAFVYGHATGPRHTSYAYLAGYDRKKNSVYHAFKMFNVVDQIEHVFSTVCSLNHSLDCGVV